MQKELNILKNFWDRIKRNTEYKALSDSNKYSCLMLGERVDKASMRKVVEKPNTMERWTAPRTCCARAHLRAGHLAVGMAQNLPHSQVQEMLHKHWGKIQLISRTSRQENIAAERY